MVAAKPDCTGQRFGLLTVIGQGSILVAKDGARSRAWVLRCDCGNEIELRRGDFDRPRKGQKSCGCMRHIGGRQLKNIAGKRFGLLTAIRPTGKKHSNKPTWLLRCDCGKYREMSLSKLGLGYRLNCGDISHGPGLHYPPMPNPMPIPVDRLVIKYLKHIHPVANLYDAEEQDQRFISLMRAGWIIVYRRSQGEEISELYERRLIFKYLRFAKSVVKRRRFVESGNVSQKGYTFARYKNDKGITMTNVTSFTEAVAQAETQPDFLHQNSKRQKFKRC